MLEREVYEGKLSQTRLRACETLLGSKPRKGIDGLLAVLGEGRLDSYSVDSAVSMLSGRLRPGDYRLARRALKQTPPPRWAMSLASLEPRKSDLKYIEPYLRSDGADPSAIGFLARYGEQAIPLLERMLHRSPEQSCRAARILSAMGYTGHIDEMELYASRNLCLARVLAEMAPGRAGPFMLAHLSSQDPAARRAAAYAVAGIPVAGIPDTVYIPVLHEMLTDEDTLVRLYAAFALGYLEDTSGARMLREAAKDTSSGQGLAAERLLSELPQPLLEPVLHRLISENLGPASRRAAQAAASLRDTTALSCLEGLLASEDHLTKRAALDAIGLIGEQSARDAVRPFLYSDYKLLEVGAILALGRLKDTAVVPKLSVMLFWEVSDFRRDGWIRHPIVDALIEIGDTSCLPYLAEIINDGDSYLAAKILGFWAERAPQDYIAYCDFFLDEYFLEPLRVEAARAIVMMSSRE